MSDGGNRDWPVVAALLLIAAALFFTIIAARQCPPVYESSESSDVEIKADTNKRPAPAAPTGLEAATSPADKLEKAAKEKGCASGPFGISADGWVAFFTLALTLSTVGLWFATIHAAERADAASLRQVLETRRIGQAQVRAYVSLVNVGVAFASWVPDDVVAQVQVTPKNDGQSPARGFVWRPTLRFYGEGKRRSRGSSLWVSQGGVTVPANSPGRPDSLLMGDMRAFQFARGHENITINLRIEFQYVDVFDNLIREETYFVGHTSVVRDQNGRPIWAGAALTSMPPMESWDAPFHGIDE
jgi:hypothetical protein